MLRSDSPGLSRVDVLELRRTLGHQRAISNALAHVHENRTTDAVVVMDEDGEDEPESVPELVAAMEPLEQRGRLTLAPKHEDSVVGT